MVEKYAKQHCTQPPLSRLPAVTSFQCLQIFDAKNPHLKIEEYVKQLKNLKWLLGLPFEIYAKVDTDALEFNDAKDDLKDDALKRDSFFANVHATIALDVLKRMLPGMFST